MITKINRKADRERRHARVRTKISGTTECPRLAVCKSNKNIIAQIIDDTKGETLVYVSTLDKDIKTKKDKFRYLYDWINRKETDRLFEKLTDEQVKWLTEVVPD